MISALNKIPSKSVFVVGDRDEMTAESNSLDVQASCSDLEESLEGILYVRKGRSSGMASWSWNRRYVVFRFEDGGSILAYNAREPTLLDHAAQLQSACSNFHRQHPQMDDSPSSDQLVLDITSDLPWLVKDVENDQHTFVIEIATDQDNLDADHEEGIEVRPELGRLLSSHMRTNLDDYESDDGSHYSQSIDYRNGEGSVDEKTTFSNKQDNLIEELNVARKRGKPLRLYFWCSEGTKEKNVWLKTFARFGRLSGEIRRRKSILGSFAANMLLGSSRIRSITNDIHQPKIQKPTVSFSRDTIYPAPLERIPEKSTHVGRVSNKDKEFKILPSYAYPHCSLTKAEMREEMLLPSEHFHDLRIPGCKDKEIGTLHVEVLQCIGLPRLDRGSDTDAVVYFVCGSYAFSSDIINNRLNPMWLRKTRRACIFPLFHGYARLYVGVFDDERSVKDDFAGRVVIDVARLRPRSTYDVTLPLRLSTHVYSRRRRGAIRLRFTLNWHSERDALLSYIPKTFKIPLPQHSKPNFNTTVMCCDQKAFRNIAITVHGAHLPRRFTFNQMRAAIREINFTRKYIFTVLRQTIRETMQWKKPIISCFVFVAWMHCVVANAFSLVPFYLVLFFLLFLMRNYAKYCTDAPSQRGFIPPSWEELFFAFARGVEVDSHHIEPLELGIHRPTLARRKSPESHLGVEFSVPQFRTVTHKHRGMKLLNALGFLPDPNKNPNDDHIEFPFADGKDYPKFTVKECLVTHGKQNSVTVVGSSDLYDCGSTAGSGDGELNRGVRFPLDMDLQRLMRKDSSGTKDYDDEENNFNASRAVISKGEISQCIYVVCMCFYRLIRFHYFLGRKAASKMTKTATALSSKTGLDYVVRPIQSGISSGVGHVSSSVGHMSSVAGHMTHQVMAMPSGIRRRSGLAQNIALTPPSGIHRDSFDDSDDDADFASSDESTGYGIPQHRRQASQNSQESVYSKQEDDLTNVQSTNSLTSQNDKIDPNLAYPEQDIDVQGPSSGKKIPDDLAEIKDKMHELTWHLFDDYAYVVKNPNAVFFGEAQKPEKRRKTNVNKQLDKYLHIGQYSHPNPFVARVGTYVEPIIGSSYSLLCLFRAGFNVVTWRDPMLTFWLSFGCVILAVALWFFPWRLFLFFVGIWLVGPQNWAFRILREQGYVTVDAKQHNKSKDEIVVNYDEVPSSQPIFTADCRKQGNDPQTPNLSSIDPKEIHHIVVPYGPLMYQRCNDWPPEPEYAQVVSTVNESNARKEIRAQYQIRRHKSLTTMDLDNGSMFGRLRRRMRRNGVVGNVSAGLPPLDPIRNRAASRD
jgi:hypothetical protein